MRKDAFRILRGNRQIHSEPMGSHKRSWTKAWKGPWEGKGRKGWVKTCPLPALVSSQ